jgi:hypothetical protein
MDIEDAIKYTKSIIENLNSLRITGKDKYRKAADDKARWLLVFLEKQKTESAKPE